jgi:hypothetical protein
MQRTKGALKNCETADGCNAKPELGDQMAAIPWNERTVIRRWPKGRFDGILKT